MRDETEYGLLIERKLSYGTEYVQAVVYRREPEKDYPLGMSGDEHAAVDGLGLYGHVMVGYTDPTEREFIGWQPEYRDVFCVDLARAEAQVKMLRRISKAWQEAAPATAGEGLRLLASLIDAKFVVMRAGAIERVQVSDGDRRYNNWVWMQMPEGRRAFDRMIAQAMTDAKSQR